MLKKLSALLASEVALLKIRNTGSIVSQQSATVRFAHSASEVAQKAGDVTLNWPLPNSVISKNPELLAAALSNARLDLCERITKKVFARGATEFTQENLSKAFKLGELAAELESCDIDSTGSKKLLVQRLYELVLKSTTYQPRQQLSGHAGYTSLPETQQELKRQPHFGTQDFIDVFSPDEVAKILVDAYAKDVVAYDVREHCSFTSYLVVATAVSHLQVTMAASAVAHKLKERCKEVAPGVTPSIEGLEDDNPDWLIVDAGSVVAHVFSPLGRKEYDLDGLWGTQTNAKQHLIERSIETLDTITTDFEWFTSPQAAQPGGRTER